MPFSSTFTTYDQAFDACFSYNKKAPKSDSRCIVPFAGSFAVVDSMTAVQLGEGYVIPTTRWIENPWATA